MVPKISPLLPQSLWGCTGSPVSPSSATRWGELKDQCQCWTTRTLCPPPPFHNKDLNSDTRGQPNAAKQQNFVCAQEKKPPKPQKLHVREPTGERKRQQHVCATCLSAYPSSCLCCFFPYIQQEFLQPLRTASYFY